MASEFDIFQAAASVYAESLLQLAVEAGRADEVGDELAALRDLWDANADFRSLMSSAAIDDDARRESITRAFQGRVSDLTLNLMRVLNDKRRSMILPLVCDAFRHRLDAHMARTEVQVVTAAPLDDRRRESIRREVKRLSGKDAILRERVEPDVLGGLRLQIDDRLFDFTIRRRLADLRLALHNAMEAHLLRTGTARFVTEG